MLRRSIDFIQTARGCVVQYSHKLSLTSRRARGLSVSVTVTKSHSRRVPRCHDATAKVRSSTQHARGKVAESRSGVKAIRETLTRSLPLGFCSRSRALFRSCKRCKHKKPFLVQHQVTSSGGRYNIRQPAFGARRLPRARGEGETPLDLLRCCVRLTI